MRMNTQQPSRLSFSIKPAKKTCKICGGLLFKEIKNINGEVKSMLVCSICNRAFDLPADPPAEEENAE